MELKFDEFKKVLKEPLKRKKKRIQLNESGLSTGVRYLDKALGGILPNDLVIIGAKTGAGKSELVTSIAMTNALKGKRVHHFALEAEEDEIMDRIIFKQVAQIYYNSSEYKGAYKKIHLNFLDWSAGKFEKELNGLEEKILPELEELLESYNVFYRSQDFGILDAMRMILSIKDQTDLIIIDHLHYIDFDEANENKAVADITKKIKDLAIISEKPIILVSHLRKMDPRYAGGLPSLEDFHGTSNISKIATKAIILAPCFDKTKDVRHFYTYMRVLKNRKDGQRSRYTARCIWDVSTNNYLPNFALGDLSFDGKTYDQITEEEIPIWMKD